MIVVVSVHAYNLGAIKYDYRILLVVTRILTLEVLRLVTRQEPQQRRHKVRLGRCM